MSDSEHESLKTILQGREQLSAISLGNPKTRTISRALLPQPVDLSHLG
jgi:hypothetical protein